MYNDSVIINAIAIKFLYKVFVENFEYRNTMHKYCIDCIRWS